MRAARVLPLLALAGCLDYEQQVVLYPDGSGKIVRRLAVKRDARNLLRALSKEKAAPSDPVAEFADLSRLKEDSRGIAAWAPVERASKDGWDSATVTAYFEDVNQVRLHLLQPSDGVLERRLEFAARYAKSASGGSLEIDPSGRDALNPDDPHFKAALPFLKDARVRFSVRAPGPVERAEGFPEKEGRDASFLFDQARIQAALKDPKGDASRELDRLLDERPRVTWASVALPEEEQAAFRREFEEARKGR